MPGTCFLSQSSLPLLSDMECRPPEPQGPPRIQTQTARTFTTLETGDQQKKKQRNAATRACVLCSFYYSPCFYAELDISPSVQKCVFFWSTFMLYAVRPLRSPLYTTTTTTTTIIKKVTHLSQGCSELQLYQEITVSKLSQCAVFIITFS
jgi:hypothetical protein